MNVFYPALNFGWCVFGIKLGKETMATGFLPYKELCVLLVVHAFTVNF